MADAKGTSERDALIQKLAAHRDISADEALVIIAALEENVAAGNAPGFTHLAEPPAGHLRLADMLDLTAAAAEDAPAAPEAPAEAASPPAE